MHALLISVGRFRPAGRSALERYAAGALRLIAAAGGEVISRGSPEETVVGRDDERPDLIAVIRFPDRRSIRRFLASAEYQDLEKDRSEAFEDIRSYIAADLNEPSAP
jgi:uncharacterized protein (DUF1330 family)